MIYVTRIRHHIGTVFDPYLWHQSLYGAFRPGSSHTPDGLRKFLSRVEMVGSQITTTLLSEEVPSPQPGWHQSKTLTLDDHYFSGKSYLFDIIVSPAYSEAPKHGAKRGVKKSIKTSEEAAAWFTKSGERNGFSVCEQDMQTVRLSPHVIKKNNNRVSIEQYHIRGSLFVTNKQSFLKAIRQGLGCNKAFHCGLLLVTPQRT